MSKIKREFVSEWYDDEPVEQEAADSFEKYGPSRAPYRGRSLENIVKTLRWTEIQQRLWRKRHGF